MGSEQQFCLRWNNHQSTLISVFDTLLESETLVDVTLAAEGQYLKAHKVVLSACSQYFQELLCHHLEKHPIIILKDVTFQELKALIDYMYRGEVNVSQEQLSALIKTAESLKIKGLADGGDRRPDRKSVPQLSPPLPPVLGPALSGNLSLDNRSMGAGEYATNSPLQHGPREGSISPVSRKRKRIRRRSGEGVAGGGAHEGEVGGGSEQASSSASTLSVPNIPATITPVNSGSRTTPGDGDGGDDEGVAGSKLDGGQEDGVQGPASSKQTKSEPGTSLQSHSRTPLLEPKSEYREEDDDDGEADEDSMDNVVALDEDVMDMEGSRDDGLDQKAGPSHGAEVSGQGSGFAPWHMMPDRSGDDIFIPSQESAAQRESQDAAMFCVQVSPSMAVNLAGVSHCTSPETAPLSQAPQRVLPIDDQRKIQGGSGRTDGLQQQADSYLQYNTTTHDDSSFLQILNVEDNISKFSSTGRVSHVGAVPALMVANQNAESALSTSNVPTVGIPHPPPLLPNHPLTSKRERHVSIGCGDSSPRGSSRASRNKGSVRFTCPTCKTTYGRHDNLMRHLRLECGKEALFHCPLCKYSAKRKFSLIRHLRRSH
ncbi:longitudinals lacking protein, isoforms A/B/D/L isoform X2 [Ischnura elegans]|uniref:longitudinals lacking protein, isoforms A/B/D/L isoform X2 n=1 Tax=Ischnura elegans TaxID=197161 RepID=UPI001ED86DEF|nr:longitudinals lacking protein, isoforms A/B/D/L isoform X2 [Ischnura elegans]